MITENLQEKNMPQNTNGRQWLLSSVLLIFLAGGLWFSAWRQAGMALPPRIEHILPMGAYGFGLFVLGYYLTHLPTHKLDLALKIMAGLNVVLALAAILTLRHYQAFFELTHRFPISAYRSSYPTDWRLYFYQPMLFAAISGSLALWLAALIAWRGGLHRLSLHRKMGK